MSQRDSKGRFVKAKPRPFKVGDRVKMLTQEGGNVPVGTVGAVTDLSASGLVEITWWSRGGTWGTYDPSRLELVEPAPQPKAEEGICKDGEPHDWRYASRYTKPGFVSTARCQRCDGRQWVPVESESSFDLPITGLVKDGAGKVIGVAYGEASESPRWKVAARVKEQDAEIATLKAEMEKLTTERNTALCGADLLKASRDGFQEALDTTMRRAEAAEAKLDDIRALVRTWKILHGLENPPTSLHEAVAVILGGAA